MKSIHKRLFLVFIVVAPMYWLVFTEDGTRRSDTLVLWMAGGDPIDLNFKAVDHRYSMEEWKQVFSDIEWQCRSESTDFGNEFCYSEISSYNGIPARYLTVFFAQDRLNAVKLVYRNLYHRQIGHDLQQQLGRPITPTPPANEEGLLRWRSAAGVVVMKADIGSDEEATLLWLSSQGQ